MTDINNMYPSKYLKSEDISTPVPVVISLVLQEMVSDAQQWVLHFQPQPGVLPVGSTGLQKALVLNKTNGFAIAEAHGGENSLWVGKTMMLTTEPTSFNGVQRMGLRLKALQQPAVPAGPPQRPGTAVSPNTVTQGPASGTNIIPNAATVPFGSTGTAQQFTEVNPPPVVDPLAPQPVADGVDDEIPF